MNRPYSEATRDKIAETLHRRYCMAGKGNECHGPTRQQVGDAEAVLDDLAGLLLPEGAETRTEYGVETTFSDGPATLPVVNLWVAQRQVAFANRAYPKRVMERKTWSTGWVSVDAAGAAVGDSKPTQDPSVSVEETPQ